MKRKQLIPAVLAGTPIGVILAGPASAEVAVLTAVPNTQIFYVDGGQVDLGAYVINGYNYVQLRDVGRAMDFGVTYDQDTNRVLVDANSPHAEESAAPAPSGVVTIPQSDEPLQLREGDRVLCDDGITYEITDLELWGSPAPLLTPACDWNQFPELELSQVAVHRLHDQYGDNLHILNLYETRRMPYTLYNAIPNHPELQEAGILKLSSKGGPILRLFMGITESSGAQTFWPWWDEQLTHVFYSAPMVRFEVEAWGVHHNGRYPYIEYKVMGM